MPVSELSVYGYRSIRQLTLKLRGVNVLVGPNGCGKSNLYNAMLLLARAAAGGFARAIAGEGGMPSALWAGVQKRYGHRAEPRRLKLAVQVDDFGYELQCGLPKPGLPQGGKDHDGFALPKSQRTRSSRRGRIAVFSGEEPVRLALVDGETRSQ